MTCASVVLPVPGGSRKMFDGSPQKLAFANNVFLADVFIQRARPHVCRSRCFAIHAFLHGVVEEIRHEMIRLS